MIPHILVICTANRCRSPMAGALLRRAFDDAGSEAHIETAGLLEGGHPAPEGVHVALARDGIDVSAHVSRAVSPELISRAGLVVTMERSHVREVVVRDRSAWPRTFTIKELVRRGERIGPRRPDETLAAWVADVHRGRRRDELLGADETDNLADPMGGPQRAFDRTAEELEVLARRIATLLAARASDGSDTGAHAFA
jgi:protein-tyrosine phosphatase